jgi:dTDP-4-dehydrorhamnose 3,5-epimerase
MIFTETKLRGAFVIDIEKHEDERGFFARSWCEKEFKVHKLNSLLKQCNISYNAQKGTMRGMHYQVKPYEEAKLVRCTMGSIYDVIVDLRETSITYKHHFGTVLTSLNRRMLYIPEGFAHGFLTLEDYTEVFYQMTEFYVPQASRGFRWNDSEFSIEWPSDILVVSERDESYPDFRSIGLHV